MRIPLQGQIVMEKTYTLKEAAERIGLTKPGIRERMKRLNEPFAKDVKGRIVLTEDALRRLESDVKKESQPESEVESGKYFPESEVESDRKLSGKSESKPESEVESDRKLSGKSESKPESEVESDRKVESAEAVALEVLREQITVKDAQIASLTEQLASVTEALVTAQRTIESSQRALEASQALHAATVKQLQAAQSVVPPTIQEEPRNPEEEKEKPEEKRWFIPDDDEEDPPLQKRKKRSLLDWLLGRD